MISGAAAGISDAACQGVNIAIGNQEQFDTKRTVTSVVVSATTTAALEGATNSLYALNGGKENLLNKKANIDSINDKVPEEDRDSVIKSLKSLVNKHALQRDKLGQIAVDTKPRNDGIRGPERTILDQGVDKNGQNILKFSDYTKTHDYKNTNGYNKSDYDKYYCKNENILNQSEFLIDQEQRHVLKKVLENEEENENELKIKND